MHKFVSAVKNGGIFVARDANRGLSFQTAC